MPHHITSHHKCSGTALHSCVLCHKSATAAQASHKRIPAHKLHTTTCTPVLVECMPPDIRSTDTPAFPLFLMSHLAIPLRPEPDDKWHEPAGSVYMVDWPPYVLCKSQNTPAGKSGATGLVVTPYAAGHLLGGAVWRLRGPSGHEILTAVDWCHRKERCVAQGASND